MRINKLINLASAGVSSELQFSGDDAPFLSRKRMLVERLSTQRSEAHDKTGERGEFLCIWPWFCVEKRAHRHLLSW